MPAKPAGSQWLKDHFKLSRYNLTHISYIGNNESIELDAEGNIERVFGPKYAPDTDVPFSHLAFALKYDHINLDFLKAVLERISPEEISAFVQKAPSSKYARKIGFLFEFLTSGTITLPRPVNANYTDLLDHEDYITGAIVKNAKWKINNNLLGSQEFCPIVRKTNKLITLLETDIHQKIEQLRKNFPPDIFKRGANYLYNRETRSSYEIENEKPSPDRMEKFIALLIRAGSLTTEQTLERGHLIALQNAIVDPRFAATGFRDFQNFVGESLPNFQDIIHYVCPPPAILSSLMNGLAAVADKSSEVFPAVKAAVIAFGFVFIHPFEDGNGRLHRFLIHDILMHDGVVPAGIVIPVSAHMLNKIKDYDGILEKYSRPLMQRIRYEKKDYGEIVVSNLEEVEGYFRYPDLTDHCIYLVEAIHATIEEDMPDELNFLQRYDETKKALQRIVDMPNKDIDLMITFLHQNKGIFPKRRREQFAKLTDEEILQMQKVYRMVYELDEI